MISAERQLAAGAESLPAWCTSILRPALRCSSIVTRRGTIASFVDGVTLHGQDAAWNRSYNRLAPFYEASQALMGRWLFGVDTERAWIEVLDLLPLRPGLRVLEISPGPGVLLPMLRARIGPDAELAALDLSPEMLKRCQMRGSGAVLFHADARDLPFVDHSFDLVFHFGGINLFNDPLAAFREFVRVTRPGGTLACGDETMAADFPEGWRKRLLVRLNPGHLVAPPAFPPLLEPMVTHRVISGLGYLVVGAKPA